MTVWQKDASGNLIAPQYFVSQTGSLGQLLTINALSFDDIGEHKIWLKIEDGGHVGFDLAEVTINITNEAPFFFDGYRPQNHSIKMNNTLIYILPKYADRENNAVFKFLSCMPDIAEWGWLTNEDTIYFNPHKWKYAGHYECVLTLTDTRNASQHFFYIDVLNFPPKFANKMKP
jgi:hypothetical protein